MADSMDGWMDPRELDGLRRVAERASEVGGEIVRASFAGRAGGGEGEADVKGAGDYVTDADRRSESAIREALSGLTPDVPVLGEEGGGERGERYWVVDPLDGTTNFMLGMPVVAVSVALVVEGRPAVGAVRAPLLGLAFWGARGLGAWAGDRRLHVSRRPAASAVVATGFPFRMKSLLPRYLPVFDTVLREAEDVRRAGAAALDLAWVAAGVFDGFFELNLGEWDVAAGALLVEEAGGVVTDWEGGGAYLAGEIMAATPATHALLRRAAEEEG